MADWRRYSLRTWALWVTLWAFLPCALSSGAVMAAPAQTKAEQEESVEKEKKKEKKRRIKRRTKKKKRKKTTRKRSRAKKKVKAKDVVITLPPQDLVAPSSSDSKPGNDVAEKKEAPGFILELNNEKKVAPKKLAPKPALEQAPAQASKKDALELDVLDFGGGDEDEVVPVAGSQKNRFAFEQALSHMAATDYGKAADEFFRILSTASLKDFHPESEYQLAKALYKAGFYGEAFQRFKFIIHQGPSHRRFQKSVEWLFRLSRVSSEQEPILRELARFRNMQFPEAYRDEYHYLLAKHFFFEARRYEKEEAFKDAGGQGFNAPQDDQGELEFSGDSSSDTGGPILEFKNSDSSDGEVVFDFTGGKRAEVTDDVMEFGTAGQPSGSKVSGDPFLARAPESLAEAVSYSHHLVERVSAQSEFYPRSVYLTALLFYLVGEDQKAVETYRSLVALLHPSTGSFLDVSLRHMAFLSLARIHYEHEQFDKSIYYYSRIPQGAEAWLVALFESSWAYFRRGDFDKALGRLLTLHSPFFATEYFPESQVVKAIIYFEACRYDEARIIVDDFFSSYNPMMERVRGMLDTRSEVDAASRIYEALSQTEENETGDDVLTSRLLGLALTDPRVAQAEKTLTQLLKERSAIVLLLSEPALVESLDLAMEQRIIRQRRIAAEATLLKFEEELETLRELLSQSIKVKLEVARAEREGIEKRLRGESGSKSLKASGAVEKTDSEHVRWPYQGEYWRDELGTYVVDFSMCEPLNEQ
jgi:outer membrane protein assembly factor BamD (BamD/ComL family)